MSQMWIAIMALVALAIGAGQALAETDGETVQQAVCRLIDDAARRQSLPASFLTRLIWQESSFRPGVTSPAGAQGVAQFMPGTARERGLADPFDPEQAIPAAAALIVDLGRRLGNQGLAAAAYNAGPTRVAQWLAGKGGLPDETRSYVLRITGRTAEEWADDAKAPPLAAAPAPTSPAPTSPAPTCLEVTAELRRSRLAVSSVIEGVVAPWGVQLSGSFSKAAAIAAFDRSRSRYAAALGDVQPMIIGTRLRNRGTRAFYRVRAPSQTRQEANALCARVRSAGGACAVLRS